MIGAKKKKANYRFYSDPGHGWLRVPRKKLEELGIAYKITPFSYQRGNWVYLEEDCDLTTFVTSIGRSNVQFREFVTSKQSKIRNYEAYRYESI